MITWQPCDHAPQNVTLLCKSGASLYFAGCRDGVWERFDGHVVEPELWLEVAP